MGEAKLYGKNGGGQKIDGIIESYPVYTNITVKPGDFVEIVDGYVRQTTKEKFNGVAKTGGSDGAVIQIYKPKIKEEERV